jgi:hypothetical protein
VASVATTVLAAIASAAAVSFADRQREHPDHRVRATDSGLLARRRQRRLPLPWAYPPAGHFVVYFAIRERREAWEGGLLDDD